MRIQSKTKKNGYKIATSVLKIVGVAGTIAVIFVAPGVAQLIQPPQRRRRTLTADVKRAINALVQRGFLRYELKSGERHLRLTRKGEKRLRSYDLDNASIVKPERWDGKWRIVFFDIPAAEHTLRDRLRRKLRELEFYQAQKSVYIHPYECFDIIARLQDFYKIKKYLRYAIVENMEGDTAYRKHFNLPKNQKI